MNPLLSHSLKTILVAKNTWKYCGDPSWCITTGDVMHSWRGWAPVQNYQEHLRQLLSIPLCLVGLSDESRTNNLLEESCSGDNGIQYKGSLETGWLRRHERPQQGIALTVLATGTAAPSHKPQCVLSRALPQRARTKELKGCSVQTVSPHHWGGLQVPPQHGLLEPLLSPSEGVSEHCPWACLPQTGQGTTLTFSFSHFSLPCTRFGVHILFLPIQWPV